MAKTINKDTFTKIKNVDNIKKSFVTTQKLTDSLEEFIKEIKLLNKKNNRTRDDKELLKLYKKEKDRIYDQIYARTTLGVVQKNAKTLTNYIPEDVKSSATTAGLGSVFGLPGLVLQQLGATKMISKGIGYGAKQIRNFALSQMYGPKDEQATTQTSGAGIWAKKEKAIEPFVKTQKDVAAIKKILLNKTKPANGKKKEKEEKETNLLDKIKNLLKVLKFLPTIGKVLLPAAGSLGLMSLLNNTLGEKGEKYAEATTAGVYQGLGKVSNTKKFTKAVLQAKQKALAKTVKSSTGTIKGAAKAESLAITKALNGKTISNASKAAKTLKTAKAVSKGAKLMKGIGPVGAAIGIGADVLQGVDEYKEAAARGDTVGKQKAVAGTAGRVGGGALGATAGAKLGMALGAFGGPIGMAIGAVLGAGAGALLGSATGDKLGRGGVDAYHSFADKKEEQIANYPTSQEPVVASNNIADEERTVILRNILGALNELNVSLSPDTQKYLDEQYLRDLNNLKPAPAPNTFNNPYDNYGFNIINPMKKN